MRDSDEDGDGRIDGGGGRHFLAARRGGAREAFWSPRQKDWRGMVRNRPRWRPVRLSERRGEARRRLGRGGAAAIGGKGRGRREREGGQEGEEGGGEELGERERGGTKGEDGGRCTAEGSYLSPLRDLT